MRSIPRNEDDEFEELREGLQRVPPHRVAVLCIGNPARGDDGFGPAVARALHGRIDAHLFDGGVAPENDLPRVSALRPAVSIIVDAVHFGGRPGTLRLLQADELREDGVSTHSTALPVLARFLEADCGSRVLVLAAQPAITAWGESLSPEMTRAVSTAVRLLVQLLGGGADTEGGA